MGLAERQQSFEEEAALGVLHVMSFIDHDQAHPLQGRIRVLPQGVHQPLGSEDLHVCVADCGLGAGRGEVGLVVAEFAAQHP